MIECRGNNGKFRNVYRAICTYVECEVCSGIRVEFAVTALMSTIDHLLSFCGLKDCMFH